MDLENNPLEYRTIDSIRERINLITKAVEGGKITNLQNQKLIASEPYQGGGKFVEVNTISPLTYSYDQVNKIGSLELLIPLIDHGQIEGLGDDDHTQYLNTTRLNSYLNGGDGITYNTGTISTDYETKNFRITSGKLNTIQDIDTNSNPTFGDLTVTGDFYVGGETVTVDAKTVQVEDNVLVLNYGELGNGVTNTYAGIEIDRGGLPSYRFVFEETTDLFKIGEIGSLQAVATRDDFPDNKAIFYWDSTTVKMATSTNFTYDGTNVSLTGTLNASSVSIGSVQTETINASGNVNILGALTASGPTSAQALSAQALSCTTLQASSTADLQTTNILGNLSITGNCSVDGDLTITGDFYVGGETVTVDAKTVQVEDNILTLNYGEPGNGVTNTHAGIEIDRGGFTGYRFVFEETTDFFKIGEIGSLQAVSTRDDFPDNKAVFYWDETTVKMATSTNFTYDGTNVSLTGALNASSINIGSAQTETINASGNINILGSLTASGPTSAQALSAQALSCTTLQASSTADLQTTNILGNLSITGNCLVAGDLTTTGDFYVGGETVTVDATTVQVEDNILILNYGEPGNGVTNTYAGIEIDRGGFPSYRFVFEETTDFFKIGEIGSLQAVATRDDLPDNKAIFYWDATTVKMATSTGLTYDGTNVSLTGALNASSINIGSAQTETINASGNINILGSLTASGPTSAQALSAQALSCTTLDITNSISNLLNLNRAFADTGGPAIIFNKRGQVGDVNGAVLSGSELGWAAYYGWDGTGYGRGSYMLAEAAENFTESAHGASLKFITTTTGTTTEALRVTMNDTGTTFTGALYMQNLALSSDKLLYAIATTEEVKAVSTSANLSFSSGTLDTIQDIQTGSSPTFSGFTLNKSLAENGGPVCIYQKRGKSGDINGAVLTGAELGFMDFYGWNGSVYSRGGYIMCTASENFSGIAHGASFDFYTTTIGTTTKALRMSMSSVGTVFTDGIFLQNLALSSDKLLYATATTEEVKAVTISSNLSFSSGTLDTIQAIQTTSSPTFDSLTLNRQSADPWSSHIDILKRGTTGDANAAVTNGSEMGHINFYGWNGSSYGRGGYIIVSASENFTGSTHGATLYIVTTTIGTTNEATRVQIDSTGTVLTNALYLQNLALSTDKLLYATATWEEVKAVSTSANLSFSSGTLDTIQDIQTSSTPSFAGMQITTPSTLTSSDTTGFRLYHGTPDYAVGFDSTHNVRAGAHGFIRSNVDAAGSAIHGFVWSAGDLSADTYTEYVIWTTVGQYVWSGNGLFTDDLSTTPFAKLHAHDETTRSADDVTSGTTMQWDFRPSAIVHGTSNWATEASPIPYIGPVLDIRARHPTANPAGAEITLGAIAGVIDPNGSPGDWVGGLAFFGKSAGVATGASSYGRYYGSDSQMDLYLSLGNGLVYFPTKVGFGTYTPFAQLHAHDETTRIDADVPTGTTLHWDFRPSAIVHATSTGTRLADPLAHVGPVLDFRVRHTSSAAGAEITMGAIAGVIDPNSSPGGWIGGLAFFGKSSGTASGSSSYGRAFGSDSQMDLYLSLGNGLVYFPTKVGFGTYSVPNGGVGSAIVAVHGPSASMVGPHMQFTTTQDSYPVFQQINWAHNDVELLFDSYYDGTYRSSSGAAFMIFKQSSLRFMAGSAAAGSPVTFSDAMIIYTDASVEITSVLNLKGLALSADQLLYATATTEEVKAVTISSNLSFSSGTLDTIQAIQTTSSPTFSGLSLGTWKQELDATNISINVNGTPTAMGARDVLLYSNDYNINYTRTPAGGQATEAIIRNVSGNTSYYHLVLLQQVDSQAISRFSCVKQVASGLAGSPGAYNGQMLIHGWFQNSLWGNYNNECIVDIDHRDYLYYSSVPKCGNINLSYTDAFLALYLKGGENYRFVLENCYILKIDDTESGSTYGDGGVPSHYTSNQLDYSQDGSFSYLYERIHTQSRNFRYVNLVYRSDVFGTLQCDSSGDLYTNMDLVLSNTQPKVELYNSDAAKTCKIYNNAGDLYITTETKSIINRGLPTTISIADYGILVAETDSKQGISIGYDTTADCGFLYSRHNGVAAKELRINSNCRIAYDGTTNVRVGSTNGGMTQTASLRLGDYTTNKGGCIYLDNYTGGNTPSIIQCTNGNLHLDNAGGGFVTYINFYSGGQIELAGPVLVYQNITIDDTSTEALLVRKNNDAGDVFIVDTSSSPTKATCTGEIIGQSGVRPGPAGSLGYVMLFLLPGVLGAFDGTSYWLIGGSRGPEKVVFLESYDTDYTITLSGLTGSTTDVSSWTLNGSATASHNATEKAFEIVGSGLENSGVSKALPAGSLTRVFRCMMKTTQTNYGTVQDTLYPVSRIYCDFIMGSTGVYMPLTWGLGWSDGTSQGYKILGSTFYMSTLDPQVGFGSNTNHVKWVMATTLSYAS